MVRIISVFISIWVLTACSSQQVQPMIGVFAEVALDSAESVISKYDDDGLQQIYTDEFHDEMARKNLTYQVSGCSDLLKPSIKLENPRLIDFKHHCSIIPSNVSMKQDEVEFFEVEFRPPSGGEGVEAYNVRRVAISLAEYALALSELVTASTPQDLKESFGEASYALVGLASNAKLLSSQGNDLSASAQALFETGSSLFGTLLAEAFEAKRYRLLAELVRSSDKTVETATRIIATWYYKKEKSEIRLAYERLEESVSLSNVAAITSKENQKELLDEVLSAYDAVVVAEEDAQWRVFVGIAQAHRAILKSFDEPKSLDELLEANSRIADLAYQAKAFSAAVKEAGESHQ